LISNLTFAGFPLGSSPAYRFDINGDASNICCGIGDNLSKLLESDLESGSYIAGKKFVKPILNVDDPHRWHLIFAEPHPEPLWLP
jgi:hypothetical protein